jgi:hypothetical protein
MVAMFEALMWNNTNWFFVFLNILTLSVINFEFSFPKAMNTFDQIHYKH